MKKMLVILASVLAIGAAGVSPASAKKVVIIKKGGHHHHMDHGYKKKIIIKHGHGRY
jgi:hypothetical protein